MLSYKKDFPIFKNNKSLVYLDSASTSQKPQQVLDVVKEYYENYNANIHRGIYPIAEKASAKVDEVRRKVAKFINAKYPEEIIFTKSTTEAINLIMYSWGKQNIISGDTIAVTVVEHHSNFVPWQQLAKEKNAKFEIIDIDVEGLLDERSLITKTKHAKLVTLPYVSNMLGTVNPIKEIIKKLKVNNFPIKSGSRMTTTIGAELKVIIDAAQAVPHMKVDVQDIDADFFVFSGHKMFAETGVGVLYAKKEILEKMPPFLFGGDMIKEVAVHETTFADLPNKFEAGTLNIAGIISLGAAIDYINSIGFEKMQAHEEMLMAISIKQLENIDGLKIYGPKDIKKRSGLISFTIDKIHAHDIAQVLADQNICVRSGHHCTMPLHKRLGIPASTRASFYIYNDEEDVKRFVDGVNRGIKFFK